MLRPMLRLLGLLLAVAPPLTAPLALGATALHLLRLVHRLLPTAPLVIAQTIAPLAFIAIAIAQTR